MLLLGLGLLLSGVVVVEDGLLLLLLLVFCGMVFLLDIMYL